MVVWSAAYAAMALGAVAITCHDAGSALDGESSETTPGRRRVARVAAFVPVLGIVAVAAAVRLCGLVPTDKALASVWGTLLLAPDLHVLYVLALASALLPARLPDTRLGDLLAGALAGGATVDRRGPYTTLGALLVPFLWAPVVVRLPGFGALPLALVAGAAVLAARSKRPWRPTPLPVERAVAIALVAVLGQAAGMYVQIAPSLRVSHVSHGVLAAAALGVGMLADPALVALAAGRALAAEPSLAPLAGKLAVGVLLGRSVIVALRGALLRPNP